MNFTGWVRKRYLAPSSFAILRSSCRLAFLFCTAIKTGHFLEPRRMAVRRQSEAVSPPPITTTRLPTPMVSSCFREACLYLRCRDEEVGCIINAGEVGAGRVFHLASISDPTPTKTAENPSAKSWSIVLSYLIYVFGAILRQRVHTLPIFQTTHLLGV